MDENLPSEDQRIVQEITGRFDSPSFIRRAKQVETSWSNLLERLEHQRGSQLEMVKLRLGQLHSLAGTWEALRALVNDADLAYLEQFHQNVKPRLRMPLTPTTSRRALRSALFDLREAMTAFNERWAALLGKTDLNPVNAVREAYNRYFLLEKECTLGSAQVARIGFQRLAPMTHDHLRAEFPLLKVPQIDP